MRLINGLRLSNCPMRRLIRWGLTALLLAAGPLPALHAQAPVRPVLSGRVVDAETGEALPGANVFVENTTFGSATDAEGYFTFDGPITLQFKLVASMLGYRTAAIQVDAEALPPDGFQLQLQPTTVELEDVSVVAERPRAWHDNLLRFEQLLLSTSPNGKRCRILNPDVLVLTYDDATDVLHATAQQPLQIENPSLGYVITIHGLDFQGRSGVSFKWEGILQFTEMEPSGRRERRRWERNRQEAYLGSVRHFLTALVAGRLEEEGFGAYYVDGMGSTSTVRPIPEMGTLNLGQVKKPPILDAAGSTDQTRMLQFTGFIYVLYQEYEPREYVEYQTKHGLRTWAATDPALAKGNEVFRGRRPIQSSWLMVPRGSTIVDTRGIEYVDYGLSRHGYWAWERLGEQLPYDYQPPADQ